MATAKRMNVTRLKLYEITFNKNKHFNLHKDFCCAIVCVLICWSIFDCCMYVCAVATSTSKKVAYTQTHTRVHIYTQPEYNIAMNWIRIRKYVQLVFASEKVINQDNFMALIFCTIFLIICSFYAYESDWVFKKIKTTAFSKCPRFFFNGRCCSVCLQLTQFTNI